ncbi:hypothetical protein [Enterococcus sp. 5H]|uniref:hypothetical protein n=1 Tax=Enterococcus sp. 5H TaxID=1229490 RepID=UPI0023036280|nr:hypothetical protein [Enterococcus sp. 5H]MDA9472068.1 hypothetical protein [Enterococcus sp. 5H]
MTEKTVELNRNQELVLQWLKDDLKDDSDEKNTLRSLFYLQKFGCCQDNEVVEAHKTLNVSQFMEVVKEFADWTLSDHQPTFEVGEYYSYRSLENVLHILKITTVMGDIVEAEFLNTQTGKLVNTRIELDMKYVQPATTEQIATFKRAEHFAAHRRKLDEFKTDDICIFRGKVVLIQELDGAGDLWFYGNQFGEEYLSKEELKHITLIQTAEELREVENNESL